MTLTEILHSIQFVVDQDGNPTAAMLDMKAWNAFLSLLEDMEDTKLLQDRFKNWRTKKDWTRWEEFECVSRAQAPAV